MKSSYRNLHSGTLILSLVTALREIDNAGLLIASLRARGGPFRECPIWIFCPEDMTRSNMLERDSHIRVVPVSLEEPFRSYPFAYKPYVASVAEAMMPPDVHTVIWLDCASFILRPPHLLALESATDTALRPVHIRNIGSLVTEPLDRYWTTIYDLVGIKVNDAHPIEPFAEVQLIRPYFNCCTYSLNATLGLFRRWWECFRLLVCDGGFQSGPCNDAAHRLFLHQAIFSALVVKCIPWERIRILPTTYGYPLHLDEQAKLLGRAETVETAVSLLAYDPMPSPDLPFFRKAPGFLRKWLRECRAEVGIAKQA